jgi:hypothetical protein
MLIYGDHSTSQDAIVSETSETFIPKYAKPSRGRAHRADPDRAFMVFKQCEDELLCELSESSEPAVLPTGQSPIRTNPESPVPRSEKAARH